MNGSGHRQDRIRSLLAGLERGGAEGPGSIGSQGAAGLPGGTPEATSSGGPAKGMGSSTNTGEPTLAATGDDGRTGCLTDPIPTRKDACLETGRAGAPAVVRRPWAGARGGRRGPRSEGARRRRARRRRPTPRPGPRGRKEPPDRHREHSRAPRSGRAEPPGPDRRRGRCRDGGPAAEQGRRRHRKPAWSAPGSPRACRGRRASRRNWRGPIDRCRRRATPPPPRFRRSRATASGGGERAESWAQYATKGKKVRRGMASAA